MILLFLPGRRYAVDYFNCDTGDEGAFEEYGDAVPFETDVAGYGEVHWITAGTVDLLEQRMILNRHPAPMKYDGTRADWFAKDRAEWWGARIPVDSAYLPYYVWANVLNVGEPTKQRDKWKIIGNKLPALPDEPAPLKKGGMDGYWEAFYAKPGSRDVRVGTVLAFRWGPDIYSIWTLDTSFDGQKEVQLRHVPGWPTEFDDQYDVTALDHTYQWAYTEIGGIKNATRYITVSRVWRVDSADKLPADYPAEP